MLVKKHRAGLLAAGALAVLATSASATTLLQMSFEDLVANSDVIIVGEAVSSRVERSASGGLVTITTFNVEDSIAGEAPATLEVEVSGGTFRSGKFLLREATPDAPVFADGSEHMLFLKDGPSDAFDIVGVNQGAAPVFKTKDGSAVMLPGGPGPQAVGAAKARILKEWDAALSRGAKPRRETGE